MFKIKGVDISNWQSGLQLRKIGVDFAIAKASEGLTFKDPTFADFMRQADNAKMLKGAYHFASNADPEAQAVFFYKRIEGVENCLPVLDLETNSVKNWGGFVESFARRFKILSGVNPVIYTSAGFLSSYAQTPYVYVNCPLWLAGYPKRAYTWNDGMIPYKTSPWARAIMWQFTGCGNLEGYKGNLDLDWCYITRDQWIALANGKAAPEIKKTIDQLAREVIAGKWGAGKERKARLEAAGYNYSQVQQLVNRLLAPNAVKTNYDIAKEVIAGKWGAGKDRKHRLELAGYNYDAVQKIVNELMKKY